MSISSANKDNQNEDEEDDIILCPIIDSDWKEYAKHSITYLPINFSLFTCCVKIPLI